MLELVHLKDDISCVGAKSAMNTYQNYRVLFELFYWFGRLSTISKDSTFKDFNYFQGFSKNLHSADGFFREFIDNKVNMQVHF